MAVAARGADGNPPGPRTGEDAEKALLGLFAGLRTALGTGSRETDLAVLERIDDWGAVARLTRRHRVTSLMLRGLRRAGAASSEAEAALGPLREMSNARGLSQLAGLRAAVDCLDKHDIKSLVLKGLPLSVRLFHSPLDRECHDIDLLVPQSDASAAADALSRGGWKMRTPPFEPTPARDSYFNRYVKNRILIGPGGFIELHHRLTNNPFLLPMRFEELDANAATIEVGGSSFLTLGDSDLLVYLCVHGQMHRWSRLKWLCDIAPLIASVEEEGFVEAVENGRRRKLAPAPAFGTALRLCREVLHVELPAAADSLASGGWTERQGSKSRSFWNRPQGGKGFQGVARRIDEMRTSLTINPSWRAAAHELARLFAAPYDLGNVNLPGRLFFLYLPLRPVLWLANRLKRNKARAATGGGTGHGGDVQRKG